MSRLDTLYFYWSNVSQNLHKLVNQRSLGVVTDTLIDKLTRVSKYIYMHALLSVTNTFVKKASNYVDLSNLYATYSGREPISKKQKSFQGITFPNGSIEKIA